MMIGNLIISLRIEAIHRNDSHPYSGVSIIFPKMKIILLFIIFDIIRKEVLFINLKKFKLFQIAHFFTFFL